MGADTVIWLCFEDRSKLEEGEFYFDRAIASKHVWGGGTRYKPEKVKQLAEILRARASDAVAAK